MRTLDPGHLFELASLDGDVVQHLQFVKRTGEGYPGNGDTPYPGTTTQEVLRALIKRTMYVARQAAEMNDESSVIEDRRVINLLRDALWRLEARAARRHGREAPLRSGWEGIAIEEVEVCGGCGHIGCEGRACGR